MNALAKQALPRDYSYTPPDGGRMQLADISRKLGWLASALYIYLCELSKRRPDGLIHVTRAGMGRAIRRPGGGKVADSLIKDALARLRASGYLIDIGKQVLNVPANRWSATPGALVPVKVYVRKVRQDTEVIGLEGRMVIPPAEVIKWAETACYRGGKRAGAGAKPGAGKLQRKSAVYPLTGGSNPSRLGGSNPSTDPDLIRIRSDLDPLKRARPAALSLSISPGPGSGGAELDCTPTYRLNSSIKGVPMTRQIPKPAPVAKPAAAAVPVAVPATQRKPAPKQDDSLGLSFAPAAQPAVPRVVGRDVPGARAVYPPHPGYSIKPPLKPQPLHLDSEAPLEDQVRAMLAAYRGAITHHFDERCTAFAGKSYDIVKFKGYEKLQEAAEALVGYGIPPIAWAHWSTAIWCEKVSERRPSKRGPGYPPITWVFSADRIEEHLGWFKAEMDSSFKGCISTKEFADFCNRWSAMDTLLEATDNVASMREIVARYFPEGYTVAVGRVKRSFEGALLYLQVKANRNEWIW